jgi:hypothetical protein
MPSATFAIYGEVSEIRGEKPQETESSMSLKANTVTWMPK